MATKKTPSARKATTKVAVRSITPFLWFDDNAAEAARFYVSLFKGSKLLRADMMGAEFRIAGQEFFALNGGPTYKLTPAFSISVSVKTQKQVDALWSALTRGGAESRCGWLVDKFGLSWQIIPERLPALLQHKDPEVAQRAMQAMLRMKKIDIAVLDRAAGLK